MSAITEKYKSMKEKLDTLLDEHDLIYKFDTSKEPIVLQVKKNESAKAEQLSLTAVDKQKSSKDATVSFIFDSGSIIVKTTGTLFMTDALLNKVKNIAKKLHYLFLHVYFVESKEGGTDQEKSKQDETKKEAAAPVKEPDKKAEKNQDAKTAEEIKKPTAPDKKENKEQKKQEANSGTGAATKGKATPAGAEVVEMPSAKKA